MILVYPACRREIDSLPEEIRSDLADAVARLDAGLMLSMPLSRPMPSIKRGAHELRLKERSGAYRVVYALIRSGRVYLVHAFKKTTRATSFKSIEIARKRLKEILR